MTIELKLRPHHVRGYWKYLRYLQESGNLKDYLEQWKRNPLHPTDLASYWGEILKKLEKNARFRYVPGYDSLCEKCENAKKCNNRKSEYFQKAKERDNSAKQDLPELKFRETYNGNYINKLTKFAKKIPKTLDDLLNLHEVLEKNNLLDNFEVVIPSKKNDLEEDIKYDPENRLIIFGYQKKEFPWEKNPRIKIEYQKRKKKLKVVVYYEWCGRDI